VHDPVGTIRLLAKQPGKESLSTTASGARLQLAHSRSQARHLGAELRDVIDQFIGYGRVGYRLSAAFASRGVQCRFTSCRCEGQVSREAGRRISLKGLKTLVDADPDSSTLLDGVGEVLARASTRTLINQATRRVTRPERGA
jgi:hypothetical protein